MRISDWSSDVCSSDLSTGPPNYFPISPPPKQRSNVMRFLTRKCLIASALSATAAGSLFVGLAMTTTPAQAIVVFDPSNYSQNLLTAARTLQQLNNQIQSLQNADRKRVV